MVRSTSTSLLAVALAVLAPAVAAAGPPPWVEVKTPAFTVLSDAGEKEARRVALQFEQMRALLKELWPWARFDASRPITVLAARDEGGLKQLAPGLWEQKGRARPVGIFAERPDRNWVALRTDVALREADAEWENPHLVVFHEYVHLVLHLNFTHLPLWLDEGLADFWGSTVIENDRIYIGRPIRRFVQTLRERAALEVGKLLAVDHGSPEYTDENRVPVFYASSWALVHYLTFGERASGGALPASERPLNRLVGLLQQGKAPADAAREVFGDPAALDRELGHYVMERGFRYQRRPMTLHVETGPWTSRPLPEAESLGVRAAFHAAMGRPTESRAMADEALKLDASCAVAYEAQAMAAYRQHERGVALRILGRAVELPAASDHAHFLYGHLLWDETRDKADLEPVQRSFQRAVDMNASYAAAYDSLARVMAARGAPPDQTFPLAARAAQLAPMVVDFKITALRMAASGGDVEGARREAQALLEHAPSDDRPKLNALLRQLQSKTPSVPDAPPEP